MQVNWLVKSKIQCFQYLYETKKHPIVQSGALIQFIISSG